VDIFYRARFAPSTSLAFCSDDAIGYDAECLVADDEEFGVCPIATLQVLRRLAAAFALTLSISCVVCATSGVAFAEPVFSFEGTPGKLPKTVVPIHYAIELKPDIVGLALAGVEIVDIERMTAEVDEVAVGVVATAGKA
jgi:hypothetical protein